MQKIYFAAALALLGSATGVAAGPVACSTDMVKAEGQRAAACLNKSGNDKTGGDSSKWTVNQEAYFGFDDWQFLAREPGEAGAADPILEVSFSKTGGDSLSGSWSIDAATLARYSEFMIVLKSGQQLAAFLFTDETLNFGTWGYATPPSLSHFSLYVRGESDRGKVPEPAALGLLGLGVLGVAALRRRS